MNNEIKKNFTQQTSIFLPRKIILVLRSFWIAWQIKDKIDLNLRTF